MILSKNPILMNHVGSLYEVLSIIIVVYKCLVHWRFINSLSS